MSDQLPSGYRVRDGCWNCRYRGGSGTVGGQARPGGFLYCHHGMPEAPSGDSEYNAYCDELETRFVNLAGWCPKYTKGGDDAN